MAPVRDESKSRISDPLPKYEYPPLQSPSSIRLLKIRPASSDTETVDCALVETDHLLISPGNGSEQYEALSWCWGTAEKTEEIQLHKDQHKFCLDVSPTLKSALTAVRQATHERVLWVDAICINQADTEEKSGQVARMDQIYTQAKNVVIWLGEGNEDTKLAMDFIKGDLLSPWKFDKLYEDPKFARHWSAMARLMQRPWFTRRWVIQEIALAKSGILQCGAQTVPWQDFSDAVTLLMEKEIGSRELSSSVSFYNTFSISDSSRRFSALGAVLLVGVLSNCFNRKKDGSIEALFNLESVVSDLPLFEATEPRDTIYALLSLAKDTTRVLHNHNKVSNRTEHLLWDWGRKHTSRQQYIVDYQQPFHEICKEFILFCIRMTSEPAKALDIICRPWAPRPVKKRIPRTKLRPKEPSTAAPDEPTDGTTPKAVDDLLASWIPSLDDVAVEMYNHPVTGPRLARKSADPLVGTTYNPTIYNAAGGKLINLSQFNFAKGQNHHSMFVQGFILDKVTQVGEPSRLGNIPETWLSMGGWDTPSTEPPEELWRTLVADHGLKGGRGPAIYARACKDCFAWILERGAPGGTFDTARVIDGSSSVVSEFLTKVQNTVWNRRLILSASERLGLAPESVAKGDLICILYGCSVPVLLRRIQKTDKQMRQEEEVVRELWQRPELEEAAIMIQKVWRQIMLKRRIERSNVGSLPQPTRVFWTRYRDTARYACLVFVAVEFLLWQPKSIELLLRTSYGHVELLKLQFFKVMLVLSLMLALNHRFILDPLKSRGRSVVLWILPKRIPESRTSKGFEGPTQNEDVGIPRYYYQFMGACYLHGMMHGEAIQYQKHAGIEAERFDLR